MCVESNSPGETGQEKLPKDKYHFGNAYYAAEVVSGV